MAIRMMVDESEIAKELKYKFGEGELEIVFDDTNDTSEKKDDQDEE